MVDFSGDNNYELELFVPDGSLLWVPDSGGVDTIVVLYAHDQLVTIDLSYRVDGSGATYSAMAQFFGGKFAIWHQLEVHGIVEHATGSTGSDMITGNEFANRLWGAADLVNAGGADTIDGGAGNDTVMGGAGNDVLSGGDDDDLMGGGAGNDRVAGNAGRDTLTGGAGQDRLDGGDGRDRLTGGLGADLLTGGTGADSFVFLLRTDSQDLAGRLDRITDFEPDGGDVINLAAIDADLTLAGNQAFRLIEGGFTGQAGELILTVLGSDTKVQADSDGDGLADFDLLVTGATLTLGDFLL